MSAEIIQFVPRLRRRHVQTDFPTTVFRFARQVDDLAMDHADVGTIENKTREGDGKE